MKMKKYLLLLVLGMVSMQIQKLSAQDLASPWYISPRAGAQHVDLNGSWELSYTDTMITSLTQLDKRKDPFATTIPNSIHWSLYKSGKLPHPYYHSNSDLYAWTDEKVWYYTKSFDLPASAAGQYIFLCFNGLDYFSRLWVNDSLIGTHEGMFGGPSVEISRLVKTGTSNKIVVELRAGDWGNKASDYHDLPRNASGERDYKKRTGYSPRASGPIIKPWVISGGSGCEMFFSLGMWQGVRLEIVPKIHLERPFLVTKSASPKNSALHLSGEVLVRTAALLQPLHPWKNEELRHPGEKGEPFIPENERISVQLEMYSSGALQYSKSFPLKLFEGRNWFEKDINLPNPKLWNPNGLGDANLYQVRLVLKKGDQAIDEQRFDYGIRVIERIRSAGPKTVDNFENWQFVVNGRKIFIKGMNFTPQDVLLETSEQRYRWTLSAAKAMGVQLIRVWGGGLLETDIFYKLCDEMGLMVWQDFPIGNQDTPLFPQATWEAQVVQNIFRLRNHASLVVWCGGNEFNPYSPGNAATMGILERNIRTFDDSRFYVRADPDAGAIHVYPDMDPTWYKKSYQYEPYISETGMHSMPEAGMFYETVNNKELTGLGNMWDTAFGSTHPEFILHFTEYGPGRVPRMLSRASHIADMKDPTIETITEATQVGAGEFYQVLSEQVQSNYPVTTGLMPWVFKRHWPVIAIQMMDWFGQAGAPYYFLKRTYEPMHISLDLPRLLWAAGETIPLDIRVMSDLEKAGTGYKASLTIYDDQFKELYKNEKPIAVQDETSVNAAQLGKFIIPADYKNRFLLILAELHNEKGQLVSRSFYYPRSLVKMEDTAYYKKYLNQPVPWLTLENGPFLKPTVAKTGTVLAMQLLSDKKISDSVNEVKVRVQNTGKIPAFMTKLDVTGVKRAFYATDNYFWLPAGASQEVTITLLWREANQQATVQVNAWNAPVIKTTLK